MANFDVYFSVRLKILQEGWDSEYAYCVFNSLTKVVPFAHEDNGICGDFVEVSACITIEAATQLDAFKQAYKIVKEHYMTVNKWTVDDFSLDTIRDVDVEFYSLYIDLFGDVVTEEVEGFVCSINDQYCKEPLHA